MSTISFSVNDNINSDFASFCDAVGLTPDEVLTVCMVKIGRDRRIPFVIDAPLKCDNPPKHTS